MQYITRITEVNHKRGRYLVEFVDIPSCHTHISDPMQLQTKVLDHLLLRLMTGYVDRGIAIPEPHVGRGIKVEIPLHIQLKIRLWNRLVETGRNMVYLQDIMDYCQLVEARRLIDFKRNTKLETLIHALARMGVETSWNFQTSPLAD